MIFSIRRGPDWSRNSGDSSGSYRDREGLEILGHSKLGTQDTPGWASTLGWLQLDQWSTKRKQTFNIQFPVQSNPWSFHLISALGQNPRLTFPRDTYRGKWGAQGDPHCHPQSPVVTQLQWLALLTSTGAEHPPRGRIPRNSWPLLRFNYCSFFASSHKSWHFLEHWTPK